MITYSDLLKRCFGCSLLKGVILFISFFIFSSAKGQVKEALTKNFDSWRKDRITEKLFLHTDKDDYLSGEIIWLKIYNVDGTFHRPLNISSVAYVELIDINGKQSLTEKIKITDGFGDGSIFLPASIETGNYILRAYTNWMKNEPAEYFFEKQVSIINPNRTIEKTVQANTPKEYNIGLFPEGGNLVSGQDNKLAFKINDKSGKGINCSGFIKDEDNNIVTKFQVQKFGMGVCIFQPSSSHSYTAQFNLADGTNTTKQLPVVYREGYSLHVEKSGDNYLVKIAATDSILTASASAFLFIHCRESIKKAVSISLTGKSSIEISNQELGDGINHITLFDKNGIPVCERLLFKYPSQSPELTITTLTGYYKTRSKINIAVGTNAKSISNLSLAIYKVDSLQDFQKSFIDDYLLLSSDLHGNIESPGYYFAKVNEQVIAAMDNLMLTNGWRRFNWQDIINDKKTAIKYIPEVAGQYITGRIINTATGKPAAGKTGFLSIPYGAAKFKTSVSDSAGNISFLLTDAFGAPGIILQTAPEDSMYRIEISPAFSAAPTNHTIPKLDVDASITETLKSHNIATQVQQSYNSKYNNHFYNPTRDTFPFFNFATESYVLDDYTRFTTIEEILREYVPYVNVRKRNGKYSLPLFDEVKVNGTFDGEPLLMVDGLPIFSADQFMRFDPLKFRQLDVITRQYYYGKSSFEGVINFTSYNKNLDGVQLDTKAMLIDYQSLQLQREFYAPDYNLEKDHLNHLPDFRYLLHWEPNISLEKNGNKKISFYSSDVKGNFVAIIQGITADGQPCKAETDFIVE